MSRRAGFHARLALGLLVAVPCLRAQERGAEKSAEAQVARILGETARPADIAARAAELAALGPRALEPLFERLCAGEASAAAALGLPATAAVRLALLELPQETLLRFLETLARRPTDDRRRAAALELLGSLAGRNELKLILDLGAPAEADAPPSPALRAVLERALSGVCSRDPGAPRVLAEFFPRAAPGAQAAIVAVLARAGGDEALGALAALLGKSSSGTDALLLLEIGHLAGRSAGCEDLLVFERVRGYLGHPMTTLGTLACGAVEKLRDQGAVPDLIVLLDDRDANLCARAHAALGTLTGLRLPRDPAPWIAWLDEGLAWWDERAEACRVDIVHGEATAAAAAIDEVAMQRLFPHEAARILALACERAEPDLLRSACRALGAIPELESHEALLVLARHPDAGVAAEASRALGRHHRARPKAFRPPPVFPLSRSSTP